jgi:dTDP-4-dehydrorhamnose reductase
MKIFVTSGNGLVGNWIKKAISPDSSDQYYFHNRQLGDLTNARVVKQIFDNFLPDVVIHNAAALNGSLDSDYAKELNAKLNLKMFKNMMENIGKDQIMICLSSYHVYSGSAPFSILRHNKLNSNSIYAAEKSKEISLARNFANVKFILLPHLFGANDNYRDKRAHFIANSIKRIDLAKKNGSKELAYFGNIDQVLQYATGEQAANFVMNVLNNGNLGKKLYINGNIGWVANSYLVFNTICDIVGYEGKICWSKNENKKRDMFFSDNNVYLNKLPSDFHAELLLSYKFFLRNLGQN